MGLSNQACCNPSAVPLEADPHCLRWAKDATKIIKSGNFKRPLTKTVRHHFGEHTTLYGGRKGFTDLMLGHQQRLENISQWMGHSSIDRTLRNYKSRTITHYDLPNKKAGRL
jgi:integrase